MNSKITKHILLATLLLILAGSQAFGEPLSSKTLIQRAEFFDNKTIEYQGEAVGDVMIRGDFAWINVLQGGKAIGIWLKTVDAKRIGITGDYFHVGDIIKVSGTFHRSCREHGGDLDIHAKRIEIVTPGHEIKHPIDTKKLVVIALLLLAAFGFLLIYRATSKP